MNEDSCSLDLVHSVVESTVPVVKHVFATYADVCAKVAEHEMLHTVHYVVTCTGSMEKNFEELFKKEHKLFYEDKDFAYTGVPFIVSTRTKLDCQHRKDRNIKKRSSIVKRKMNKLVQITIAKKTESFCRIPKNLIALPRFILKKLLNFQSLSFQKIQIG